MHLSWFINPNDRSCLLNSDIFRKPSNFSKDRNENSINSKYELIRPIPEIGRLNITFQNLDCERLNIVEEDKDLIAGLINYRFNSSGLNYMLSLKYPRMENLGQVIGLILGRIFTELNEIYENKPLTFENVYDNLHLFDKVQHIFHLD